MNGGACGAFLDGGFGFGVSLLAAERFLRGWMASDGAFVCLGGMPCAAFRCSSARRIVPPVAPMGSGMARVEPSMEPPTLLPVRSTRPTRPPAQLAAARWGRWAWKAKKPWGSECGWR